MHLTTTIGRQAGRQRGGQTGHTHRHINFATVQLRTVKTQQFTVVNRTATCFGCTRQPSSGRVFHGCTRIKLYSCRHTQKNARSEICPNARYSTFTYRPSWDWTRPCAMRGRRPAFWDTVRPVYAYIGRELRTCTASSCRCRLEILLCVLRSQFYVY